MKYTIKLKLRRKTLLISGMTCHSCAERIEKSLIKAGGVTLADADFGSSRLQVKYDIHKITLNQIIQIIEKLGYAAEPQPKKSMIPSLDKKTNNNSGKNSADKMDVSTLLLIGISIYFIYHTFQRLGLGVGFLPQIDQNMGYGILFVIGLLTSLHCIAMCGGINLSQCLSVQYEKRPGKFSRFTGSILYNTGRVLSYTVIGGIVGGIGSVVSFSGWAKGIVAVIAGLLMILMGLRMLNIFPVLRKIHFGLPHSFHRLIGRNEKRGPFLVGLLNGLMPCGPLQAMQIYALGTGSVLVGAVSMFFFSLGTVPLMFGLGALSSFLSGRFTRQVMKASAVFVMILGMIMFNRGLGLSGISVFPEQAKTAATVQGNVQTVTTSLESGQYTPITVQEGIPVKWTIIVESNDLNGCNNPLTIPKYNYQKKLVPGNNVIEFIPEQEGNIVYTCWMGMIRSNITVVKDLNNID